MPDKQIILLAYALLGIALALIPFMPRRLFAQAQNTQTWDAPTPDRTERWASAISLGFSLASLYWSQSLASPALASISVVLALLFVLNRGHIDRDQAIGAVAGLVIAATLVWWLRDGAGLLTMSWTSLPVFFLASLSVCHAMRLPASQGSPPRVAVRGLIALGFVLVAATICFGTGVFPSSAMEGRTVGDAAWHHWGAYVGPSEMVLAGARLFHDVPAQYGLGPTLLIAALCFDSCWTGIYWLAGFCNLAFVISIAAIGYKLRGAGRTTAETAVLALLCLFCCLLWTAYPVDLRTPIVWPSVGGMRFLPVVALVLLLVWKETADPRNEVQQQPARWGHLAWAIGVLWSPESAFCVTFVWWPYYLWRQCAGAAAGDLAANVVRAVLTLLLYMAGLIGFFISVYWLAYSTIPTRVGLLAYFLHPPGAEPINPGGAVWFFLAAMILGVLSIFNIYRRGGDSVQFRRAFLVLLLAYGTFSYFLGRSVDNNLLNLMPYQLLVLLVVVDSGLPKAGRQMAVVMLASLLASASLFGWGVWLEAARAGRLLEFEPRKRIEMFKQDPDAERAVAFISERLGESALVFDGRYNLTVTDQPAAWSAFHGPANFVYLPPEMRRQFLLNTAQTLRRSGWIVVRRHAPANASDADANKVRLLDPAGLLQDIYHVYRPTQGVDFGNYHAIRFEPR